MVFSSPPAKPYKRSGNYRPQHSTLFMPTHWSYRRPLQNHQELRFYKTFGVATLTSNILFPRKCSPDNAPWCQQNMQKQQNAQLLTRSGIQIWISKRPNFTNSLTFASSSDANVTYPNPRDRPVDRSYK